MGAAVSPSKTPARSMLLLLFEHFFFLYAKSPFLSCLLFRCDSILVVWKKKIPGTLDPWTQVFYPQHIVCSPVRGMGRRQIWERCGRVCPAPRVCVKGMGG